ncbi:MAG: YibE/F family protein [Treponema sp.]|nr:YibE/F family protein [Treponema sp.]
MKLHISGRQLISDIVLAVLIILYTTCTMLISRHTSYYDIYKLSGRDSVSFEKAVVTAVSSEKLENHSVQKGMVTGIQNLTVRILSGQYAGKVVPFTNYLNYDTSYRFTRGNHLIVSVNATGDKKIFHVFVSTPDRLPVLCLFAILIIILLCTAGGRQGFRSVLAIVFTLSSILFVFIPLVYRGIQPAGTAVLLAAVTAGITLPLTGGTGRKTAAAAAGTLVCLSLAAGVQTVFCRLTMVSGFTFGDTDSLMQIAAHSGLKIGGLLFAAVLISSLGAVMDIAMSIASAVNEVHLNNQSAGFGELFTAGIHMGRDMMGTMANTLILAFTGSSLVMLVQIYTYNMQPDQVLNSNSIAVEIIQALSGSFAVISAVPVVSALSAELLCCKGSRSK